MQRAVVSLPDHRYYMWQALVQSLALRRLGWRVTYLVYFTTRKPSQQARNLEKAVNGFGEVIFWRDWRDRTTYNAAMKPWLVGKWLEQDPGRAAEPFVLMDPDVIPTGATKLPQPTPERWYGTDTDSYTGPGYLKSKGEGLWEDLCRIAEVDPQSAALVPGIGAQYAAVGQGADFWVEVAEKSVEAYLHMVKTEQMYCPEAPVQAWCSEMYFMQLVMLRHGIEPVMSPEMSMVWANGPASGWETEGFFHSAGVTQENKRDFCKLTYQNSPWGRTLHVSPESASARYVYLIREATQELPHLVWR